MFNTKIKNIRRVTIETTPDKKDKAQEYAVNNGYTTLVRSGPKMIDTGVDLSIYIAIYEKRV